VSLMGAAVTDDGPTSGPSLQGRRVDG
jgi:hypothetical protein